MILCIRLLSVTCRSALIQRMGSSASQPTTTTVRYPVLQHRPFRSRSQSFPIAWLEIHRAHRHAARSGGPSWRVQPVVPARCLTKLPELYRQARITPSLACGTARSLVLATFRRTWSAARVRRRHEFASYLQRCQLTAMYFCRGVDISPAGKIGAQEIPQGESVDHPTT